MAIPLLIKITDVELTHFYMRKTNKRTELIAY